MQENKQKYNKKLYILILKLVFLNILRKQIMCNLKNTLSFLILLGCVFFASCLDDNITSPETKKNDKFQNGTLTSLEGTVCIHHPDIDPLY